VTFIINFINRHRLYIFPILLILLDVGAAVMCFRDRDVKHGIYWLAAAVLNVCVTF